MSGKIEYQYLSSKIGKDNEIESMLKEAWIILESVKNNGDNELYEKFKKEYQELEKIIKKDSNDIKKISQEDRKRIILELGGMIKLAENNAIIEEKGFFSKVGDYFKGTNTEEVKDKALNFRDKDVDDYTKEEAIAAINYLSDNYSKYKQEEEISKYTTFFYSTINQLDDKYKVRLFQDILIKKIFGENKQYNEQYILGFNNEKGNYTTKIEDFEKKISQDNTKIIGENEDLTVINSRELANYFMYLKEIKANNDSKKFIKELGEKFKKEKILQIQQLWKNNNETIAQNILKDLDDFEVYNQIVDINIDDFFNKYGTIENSKDDLEDIVLFLKPEDIMILDSDKIKKIRYENLHILTKSNIKVVMHLLKNGGKIEVSSLPIDFYNNISDIKQVDILLDKLNLYDENNKKNLGIFIKNIAIYGDDNKKKEILDYINKNEKIKIDREKINKYINVFNELKDNIGNYKSLDEIINKKENEYTTSEIRYDKQKIIECNLYIKNNGINKEKDQKALMKLYKELNINDDKNIFQHFPELLYHIKETYDFLSEILEDNPDSFISLTNDLKNNENILEKYIKVKKSQINNEEKSIDKEYVKNLLSSFSGVELNFKKIEFFYNEITKTIINKNGEEKTIELFGDLFASTSLYHYFEQNIKLFKEDKNLENKELIEFFKKVIESGDSILKELVNENKEKFEELKTKIDEKTDKEEFKKNLEKKLKEKFELDDEKIRRIIYLVDGYLYQDKPIEETTRKLYEIIGNNSNKLEENKKAMDTIVSIINDILKNKSDIIQNKGKELGVKKEEIEEIKQKNPKKEGESDEDYKKRIFEITCKEKNIDPNIDKGQILKKFVYEVIRYEEDIKVVKVIQKDPENYGLYIKATINGYDGDYSTYRKENNLPLLDSLHGNTKELKPGSSEYIYPNGENFTYTIISGGKIMIDGLEIPKKDLEIIKRSPESKNNYINFYNTLHELGLGKLWKYKDHILGVIGDKYSGLFNFRGKNFVGEKELKIFLICIGKSLGHEISSSYDLPKIKQEILKLNKAFISGKAQQISYSKGTTLEMGFINKFDPNNTGIRKYNFKDSISKLDFIKA